VLLLAATLAPEARATHGGTDTCQCAFGDGLFTLAAPGSITLDGAFGDWGAIFADTDNNTCDGPSHNDGGNPLGPPILDRDAPVQSTGRDVTHFAYTWESGTLDPNSFIYIFTERSGSASNTQSFAYYADVNNDGLMQTGEPVIGVTWKGSNQNVNVLLYSYQAVAGGGDTMLDGGGLADGFGLPGTLSGGTTLRSGTWGGAGNLRMEFGVTWAELGFATAGAPFLFHISASNASLGAASWPAQVDDNLGGCGGGPGGTQFAAVAFAPDVALSGAHGATLTAAHSITNNGNGSDIFDLSSVISGAHTPVVSYYLDADASGTLTAGDSVLTDTDGDAVPDTGLLATAAVFNLLITYDIANNSAWDPSGISTIITTATSSFDTNVTAAVTDTVEALITAEPLVMKSVTTVSDPVNGTTNPKAIPGATLAYLVTVTNLGGAPVDSDTIVMTDPVPTDSAVFVGDLGAPGSGPVAFADGVEASGLSYTFVSLASAADDLEFSNDGGATFTYVPVPDASGFDASVTHLQVNPKGVFAATTALTDPNSPSFNLTFRIRVD
jgi:uncharacterized repeat protein (TIGR01451 family)